MKPTGRDAHALLHAATVELRAAEQALAVLEVLQVLREAVWMVYGRQAQQAWRDQLMPDHGPPDFDPDLPF